MAAGSSSPVVRIAWLLLVWLGLTGLLVAAGIGVDHSSGVAAFDHHVTSFVVSHRSPGLNAAMKVITWLGSWVALTTVGVLILVYAIRGRLPWAAVLAALTAWVGEAGAVAVAKHVVQRQRPPARVWLVSAHGWSWPSGHAATAALVFAVLALGASRAGWSSPRTTGVWIVAVLATAVVGFSRIELGVHWTTDVLASYAFVSLWLLAVVSLFPVTISGNTRMHPTGQPGAGQVGTTLGGS